MILFFFNTPDSDANGSELMCSLITNSSGFNFASQPVCVADWQR